MAIKTSIAARVFTPPTVTRTASVESILPSNFYKRFGVNRAMELSHPKLYDQALFEFPLSSVYHHITYEGAELGPDETDIVYRGHRQSLPVHHVTKLTSMEGNPRTAGITPNTLITEFNHARIRMRNCKELPGLFSATSIPATINYSLLGKLWHYAPTALAHYYRWKNAFTTMVDTISEALATNSTFHHYVFLNAPKIIPSYQALERVCDEFNLTTIRPFRDNDSYAFLELYKLMSRAGEGASIYHRLPENQMHRVTLVFMEAGKWFMLNLGQALSYAESAKDVTALVNHAPFHLTDKQMALSAIRMILSLNTARAEAAKKASEELAEQERVAALQKVKSTPGEDLPSVGGSPELDPGELEGEGGNASDSPEAQAVIEAELELEKQEAGQSSGDEAAGSIVPEAHDLDDRELLQVFGKDGVGDILATREAQIEEDIRLLEEVSSKEIAKIEESLADPEAIQSKMLGEVFSAGWPSPENAVVNASERMLADMRITPAQQRTFVKNALRYKEIKAPDGTSLEEFTQITPEMLKIDHDSELPGDVTVDERSKKAAMLQFDKKYIKEVLHRDIASMVLNMQNAGYALRDYSVEVVKDITGAHEVHTIKYVPVEGTPSVLSMRVPHVDKDGIITNNGTRYRYRKQRGDDPIRKIAPNRVALTSYYGKCFITRGRTASSNTGTWLANQVRAAVLADTQKYRVEFANCFDQTVKAPRHFSALSTSFRSINFSGMTLCFDVEQLEELIPKQMKPRHEQDGAIFMGKAADGYLLMDRFNKIHLVKPSGEVSDFGTILSLFSLNPRNMPDEYVSVGVFGKDVPIAVVLGISMGFDNLLALLGAKCRRVPVGGRVMLGDNEYSIVFNDETLVFDRSNRLAALILPGLNEYHKALRQFSAASFNQPAAYLTLMESAGLRIRYLREIELMESLFIDPITRDLLIEMKEPLTFRGLLLRATQMLLTDDHPDELDPKHMRIKGYERVAGQVYATLVQAARMHNGRIGKQGFGLEVRPFEVFRKTMEDPSMMLVADINPIKSIKETEAVTLAGDGGRSKRSMVKSTRGFHRNDMGLISESTVDNSDVGINVFTSANPQLTSLRGKSRPFSFKDHGPASLLSTSAMLAPLSDKDDPKRVNFVGIQQEHTVPCVDYIQPIVGTGYEPMLAARTTNDLFCVMAEKPGTVRSINEHGIVVDYDDGDAVGVELGIRFGNAAGLSVVHRVITTLKVGERVEKHQAIAYNSEFFEPWFFDKKQLALKTGTYATTVFWENNGTHEDSSIFSESLSKRLTSSVGKPKDIVVSFNEGVARLVEIGDKVQADTALCLIQDATSSRAGAFTEEALDTLLRLQTNSPRSGEEGYIAHIEVYYNGDKEDMSDSLREIATKYDNLRKKKAQSSGADYFSGKVTNGYRIDKDPLPAEHMAIRVYIVSETAAGVGDKAVYFNQMKSVSGGVMADTMKTEDGRLIEAQFSTTGVFNRIVNSPFAIAMAAELLTRPITDRFVKAYFGE